MSDVVIRAENISKLYHIGSGEKAKHRTLKNTLADIFSSPFRSRDTANSKIWALDNISFEVKQGEVLGIIGRNGAGKSTLLKILSRITKPTKGYIRIHGRVGSLLEVGTGFHAELTGRENIFLNGAILGMGRREIERKFDEIVAFSEVEKFIDTPVKRYSSGMYMRLAFSVAAHLEPDILIVDEVLAVGDAVFQKKCLGKMGDVAKEGRTVLFVSHNMNAIEQLCSSAMLLENGSIECFNEDVREVVTRYLFSDEEIGNTSEWINVKNEYENTSFVPRRFVVCDENGQKKLLPISNDDQAYLQVEGDVKTNDPALTIGYAIYSGDGHLLYWSYHTDVPDEFRIPLPINGRCVLRAKLPRRILNEGDYRIELLVSLYYRMWILSPELGTPIVNISIQGGLSDSSYWVAKRPGLLAPLIEWRIIE